MAFSNPRRTQDIGPAAWAHNRWPTVGLTTGAGSGLVLGVALYKGVLWTIGMTVGLALIGCLVGFVLASIIYRGTDW